jgi:hypothetical protein
VKELNRTAMHFLNSRGQGGNFRVDTRGNELIDFSRPYQIQTHQMRRLRVFTKQTEFEVEENENWYSVSFGMPRWSVFRLYPVDNSIQKLGNQDLAYSFE